jgi:hypothetical protein
MIILLNGPPRSGKDTAAEFIIQLLGNSKVHHEKFSKPMKSGLRRMFDYSDTEMKALEKYKETEQVTAHEDRGLISWRQMQIELFKHLERVYGEDVLGRIFLQRNRNNGKMHTVISDAGRTVELAPLIKQVPYGQLGLIRLSRPGCSYAGDIREDVKSEGIEHVAHIDNIHDKDMYKVQIRRVLIQWGLMEKLDEDR